MIVSNNKTKAQYPISKADFEGMPKGVRDGFTIISDEETTVQQIQAIQIGPGTNTNKAVEPSTGEKKTSGKKKDENKKKK